jgi:hypothetical protein
VLSGKWKRQFRDLCKHVLSREKRLTGGARGTRFLEGNARTVNQLAKMSRFKESRLEVIVAQPGL